MFWVKKISCPNLGFGGWFIGVSGKVQGGNVSKSGWGKSGGSWKYIFDITVFILKAIEVKFNKYS